MLSVIETGVAYGNEAKAQASRAPIRQGRVAANTVKLSSSERELLAISKAGWAIAKRQERIVKVALRTSIEEDADRAGRSTRTVNRLLARYRVNLTLLAFLPRKRGPAVGSRRLDPAREAIVEEAVDKWMPPLPTLRSFFSEMLRSLDCTVIIGSRISELEHDTLRQLKKAKPRLLAIDEIHSGRSITY